MRPFHTLLAIAGLTALTLFAPLCLCSPVVSSYAACQQGHSLHTTASNQQVCLDIDECALNMHSCNATRLEQCHNTRGGHLCVCQAGYKRNRVTDECEDFDECSASEYNDCHENATCRNEIGGFSCMCNAGLEGDGRTCVDCTPRMTKVTAWDGASGDQFGRSVSVASMGQGNAVAIVGSPNDNDRGSQSGSVFVFSGLQGANFSQKVKLTADDGYTQ